MPESVKQPIKILLVDDHALFRESLARLLQAEADFEVVAHCRSVEEAVSILGKRQVDIVLLDFDFGQRDGRDFMRLVKEQGFNGKVLLVTAGVAEREAADLIRNGICGVFMKHNSPVLLSQGIREVMAGKVWFDQELLKDAINASATGLSAPQAERFTRRERLVLSYVFEGLANKEIATRIGVSESSVKATLQQLFSKTGVRTRSQLVRIALEQYKNQL